MRDMIASAPVRSRRNVIKDATVRDYSGGWNVVDNELNLDTKYAVLLDNMSREEDGSMGIRWGTKRFMSIDDVQWYDPADFTPVPFDTTSAGGSYPPSNIVGIDNPAAWHDGTLSQTLAASSSFTLVAGGGGIVNAVVVYQGTFVAPELLHACAVIRPSDGWYTGTIPNQTEIVFTLEYNDGTNWIVARRQSYQAGALPEHFLAVVPEPNASVVAASVRLTIAFPSIVKNVDVTFGIAEMRAYEYTGTGQLPGEVYIVNIIYFQDSVITVLSNGVILRTLGDGTTSVVWSYAIAAGLSGSPPGWGPTDFASFAIFNGNLIICNGSDKPLIVDFGNTPPVQYLQDLGTSSNANTPICRYVVAMNRYLVMAGDPIFPDRVHISSYDTSGTWFGDPGTDNDATYVDLGKVGVQGEQTITGINRFREQLVVTFFSATVLGKLGIYDDTGAHKPSFDDVIEGFGGHSHRCLVNLGKDLFCLDNQGITSIARTLFSGTTDPKRVSELIDPEVNKNVNRLLEADTVLGAHAVYNSGDKQYMCFIPNHSEYAREMAIDSLQILQQRTGSLWARIPTHNMLVGDQFVIEGAEDWNDVDVVTQINGVTQTVTRVINEDIVEFEPEGLVTDGDKTIMGGGANMTYTPLWTETLGYIYTFVDELKVRAWARFRNWRWRASCRTELGNVIFADDRRLFVYGHTNNPLYQDFIDTDDVINIAFAWELPWADFDKRVHEKHTRYIQFDTNGTAEFTCLMFVDNLYKLEGLLIPNNAMTFVGGDNGGFGNNGQPYGGGRRTQDQRLYAWPARGKLFKVRFEGVIGEPLRIIAFSLLYQDGSIRR